MSILGGVLGIVLLAVGTKAHGQATAREATSTAAAGAMASAAASEKLADWDKGPQRVSIVSLIAEPRRFHGEEVLLTGFVAASEGHAVVSLNRESLIYPIFENTIYLDLSDCTEKDEFTAIGNGRCCRLRGVVDASRRAPPGWEMLDPFYPCTLVVKSFYDLVEPSRGQSVRGMLPAAEPGRHKVERQLREELLGKWQSVEYFSQGMPEFDGATNILLVVSNVFVVGVRDSGEDFTAEVYGCLYLQLRDGVRQLQPQSRKIELDRDEIRFCYGPDAYSFKYQLSDKWLLLGRNSKEEVLTARLRRLTKRPEQ